MDLKNKIALVTGAGRGIGKATALALAKQGAHVIVTARTKSEIDNVASEVKKLGSKTLAISADISREEDVSNLVKTAIETFGTIDILINNAGIGYFQNVADLPVAEFDAMWQVNMRGLFLCTKAVLPFMIKQSSGDILNIASLAGRNAFVAGGGYCATKWALVGFARCLMLEVRQHNIRVITLCPGSVDTSFGPRDLHLKDTSRIPKGEDIAQVAVDTLLMPRHVLVSEVDIRPTNPKG
jgi:3-oxoacyl-[acyl-carrier protein] reductase